MIWLGLYLLIGVIVAVYAVRLSSHELPANPPDRYGVGGLLFFAFTLFWGAYLFVFAVVVLGRVVLWRRK